MSAAHTRNELPTQSRLVELLDYQPETGRFFWKARTPDDFAFNMFPEACAKQFNTVYNGSRAFTTLHNLEVPKYGYQGVIEGVSYTAGRIAWKIVHGFDPCEIMAINGDLRNTAIANLINGELVDVHRNKNVPVNNTSGVRGVYWNKQKRKWQAQIVVASKNIPLGRFDNLADAKRARASAELKFGFRTGGVF